MRGRRKASQRQRMVVYKKKLLSLVARQKINQSLGFFIKRVRCEHQINKKYQVRIFYLGNSIQRLPHVVVFCTSGIYYRFDLEVFYARKISPHLFCDEMAVCVCMADYEYRLFHGVHPSFSAIAGVTTIETFAFARLSCPLSDAARAATEFSHIFWNALCVGRFISIWAKFPFVVGASSNGPRGLSSPTKSSSAVTGDRRVGGNSGKSPNTSASDGHECASNGISRTTCNAVNPPGGGSFTMEAVTLHKGSSPKASIAAAVHSRVVSCGKTRVTAAADLSEINSITISATSLATSDGAEGLDTRMTRCPYFSGLVAINRANTQPILGLVRRQAIYCALESKFLPLRFAERELTLQPRPPSAAVAAESQGNIETCLAIRPALASIGE